MKTTYLLCTAVATMTLLASCSTTQTATSAMSGTTVTGIHQSPETWTPVAEIDFSAKSNVLIQNPDGSYTPMPVPYYKSELVAPGTWKIVGDGDYCYLVEGENEAIMIDCGYGAGNICSYAQSLTDKPVTSVINTHYHFDHTANDAYFDMAYMTEYTERYATIPYPSFDGVSFPRDYPVTIVHEGDTLDLGGRTLEFFELGNHTPGGLAMLDATNGILFSGDEIMPPLRLTISVAKEKAYLEKLEARRSDFTMICAGVGVLDASVLDDAYALLSGVLDGSIVGTALQTGGSAYQNNTVSDVDGKTVYIRQRVRPEDRDTSGGTTATVQAKLGSVTLTYDPSNIN